MLFRSGRVSASGTGPYKLVSLDRNDGVKLERFDKLMQVGHLRASIRRIHGVWSPDKQTQIAHLMTGGIDLLTNVTSDMARELGDRPGFATSARPSKNLLFINLDSSGRSPNKAMTDDRVRKAFIMAIPRDLIVKNIVAGGDKAELPRSICFKATIGCEPTVDPYTYNPSEAKRLLIEAGYGNGVDLTIAAHAPWKSIAEAIAGEVRKVGIELGMPDRMVWRQPFPGPGLGVRIIGEVTQERVAILQHADEIVRHEIRDAGMERDIWQAFAVLADIRSVGVMGDERTYGHPIIIRAVNSDDAMTADWVRLPYELLEKMSNRITNEVRGVNRVVYDITSKPPGTIEWE